ncbi:MAG: hypothetical protein AAFO75_04010, partial [Pseudomonadota bacterium]
EFDRSLPAWRAVFATMDPTQCGCPAGEDQKNRLSAAWLKAIDEAFTPSALQEHMQEHLANAFTEHELQSLVETAATPIARRFSKAMADTNAANAEQTSEAEATKEFIARFRELEKDKARHLALQGIMAFGRMTEHTTDAIQNTAIGISLGVMAAQSEGQATIDEASVVRSIRATRRDTYDVVQAALPITLASSYSQFTMAELKSYEALLKQRLYARSNVVLNEAFQKALRWQGHLIGYRFGHLAKLVDL